MVALPYFRAMKQPTTIFDKLKDLNVLIVGDVMIDRYWHGKVSRISPEAPVPVVEWQHTEDRLGGAANVALNIRAMGATPYLFSVLGKDIEGSHFIKLMNTNDLSVRGLIHATNRLTTVKTRIMAGTHQMLRVDAETIEDVNDKIKAEFMTRMREFLDIKEIHVIIFQDYNKGVLTRTIIREVMLEAVKRDIPTAVDPKKHHFFEYQNATLFKPNLKEIRDAAPFNVTTELTSLHQADDFLRKKLNNKLTMITLSEKGLYLSGNPTKTQNSKLETETAAQIYPTQKRNISDVSGAGDTVISVASLGLAAGWSATEMAEVANLAGSQVCEVAGVVPVDLEKLKAEYAQHV
jgi:D-glycero-beta-D-manno-heptose-7-phosphate kinase